MFWVGDIDELNGLVRKYNKLKTTLLVRVHTPNDTPSLRDSILRDIVTQMRSGGILKVVSLIWP